MPHFFIKSDLIKNNTIEVTDKELLKHLVSSLRIKQGETLSFFDENKIKYETKVISIEKNCLKSEIIKKYPSKRFLDLNIYLMASILKQDAFFELISGVTQLGIKGFYPIYTDNTTVSKEMIKNKIEKWQKISDEAVKQCERADFMKVFETTTLKKIDFKNFDEVIVFSEIEQTNTLKSVLKNIKSDKKILVIVGPEGGFSKNEFEFFKQNNFHQVTISKLIFKAQTASITGLANIIYELEKWI